VNKPTIENQEPRARNLQIRKMNQKRPPTVKILLPNPQMWKTNSKKQLRSKDEPPHLSSSDLQV